jgi:hypothetical protein
MKLIGYVLVATMLMMEAGLAQATREGERLTVSGCLQRAQRDGSAGGTVVGTSAPPNVADREANSSEMVNAFMLADAVPVTANSSAAAVGAGSDTVATGTSGRAQPTTFGLEGREAELERHTGARLQVVGTVIPPATSGRGAGGTATAAGAKRLRVESFTVVAAQCSVR